MNPKHTNSNGDHAGQITREALDSDEHPNSLPIAVIFDVTASNARAARIIHGKLPQLDGVIRRQGWVEDPQILFGAVGDAFSDKVPLQISQYESDNTMDRHLSNILLENGGGAQQHETYELAAYFLARHTYLDSFEKRGKKGYVFFTGDEMPYDAVKNQYGGFQNHTLDNLIGDSLEADLDTGQIFAELQEKNEVFFLFTGAQGSYVPEEILPAWRPLIGERALILDDANQICETIALAIGVNEGVVDLSQGMEILSEVSTDLSAVRAAGEALANVTPTGNNGSVATTTGSLPDIHDHVIDDGTERL